MLMQNLPVPPTLSMPMTRLGKTGLCVYGIEALLIARRIAIEHDRGGGGKSLYLPAQVGRAADEADNVRILAQF